ncbi:MAG: DUF4159 domain-containing protein [Candidatus Latescibacteria bacterium]|nr:DUF4159 domain-containing protein [Candidatus Latescibacterota bacterium]
MSIRPCLIFLFLATASAATAQAPESSPIDSLLRAGHRSVLVRDGSDPRNLSGRFLLAQVYSVRNTARTSTRALPNLAEAVSEYSAIDVQLAPLLPLSSRKLQQAPWIFLHQSQRPYSDRELKNLGRYLQGGGFVVADAGTTLGAEADISMRENISQALAHVGVQVHFKRLRRNHALYSAFFHFDAPPPIPLGAAGSGRNNIDYLIGVELAGRLVAVLSYQNLAATWANQVNAYDNARHLQFGVNLMVFGLTQQNSKTFFLQQPKADIAPTAPSYGSD